MTEENRIILEKRHARHEAMLHCCFIIALTAFVFGFTAYVRGIG